MKARDFLKEIALSLDQIAERLSQPQFDHTSFAYRSVAEAASELMGRSSDEISSLSDEMKSLVDNMDIAEEEWIEFVSLTEGGVDNTRQNEEFMQEYKKYTQYWEENNFPSDENVSPTTYEEKHGK